MKLLNISQFKRKFMRARQFYLWQKDCKDDGFDHCNWTHSHTYIYVYNLHIIIRLDAIASHTDAR